MGPEACAPWDQVTLGPPDSDTCAMRGNPLRFQAEVKGEAQVMTAATPHSIILLSADSGLVRGNLCGLAEVLLGIPRTQPYHLHQVVTGKSCMCGIWTWWEEPCRRTSDSVWVKLAICVRTLECRDAPGRG